MRNYTTALASGVPLFALALAGCTHGNSIDCANGAVTDTVVKLLMRQTPEYQNVVAISQTFGQPLPPDTDEKLEAAFRQGVEPTFTDIATFTSSKNSLSCRATMHGYHPLSDPKHEGSKFSKPVSYTVKIADDGEHFIVQLDD